MYNLGKNMRARYYRLLPSDGLYTPNNINVLSSAAERCIMSSQSLLAGFLPPLESENMLPIQWQPIAITTVPRSLDYVSEYFEFIKLGYLLRKKKNNSILVNCTKEIVPEI